MSRKEMLVLPDRPEWIDAEQEELAALRRLECWEKVARSSATMQETTKLWFRVQAETSSRIGARKEKGQIVYQGMERRCVECRDICTSGAHGDCSRCIKPRSA